MSGASRRASRLAPAKINLTLHVTGQAADGYHLLDSLVVFTDLGDEVSVRDHPGLTLDLSGDHAVGLATEGDNLVLRAARLAGAQDVAIALDKRLPVASGMGGGSSDAAATLHLLAQTRGLPLPTIPQAMQLGADVPVCLAAPQPMRMRGLGERVDPVAGVPPLWLVLVNPGQGLSTPAVFKDLARKDNPPMPENLPGWSDARALCAWLTAQRNDLEAPAQGLVPAITDVLAALRGQAGCLLARMTGSGATCFGVFPDQRTAQDGAAQMQRAGWYGAATRSAASLS